MKAPVIAVAPSDAEVRSAVDLLIDLVRDFPFQSDIDRAGWLAALLTPLARPMFTGPSPLMVFDANVRGSGKTFLAELIGLIVNGRSMPRIAPAKADDEERKRITSVLLAGRQVALIDNVTTVVGSPALDALLTATTWEDRVIGLSKMLSLEARTCWYLTGNNVEFRGDTSRRVLVVRLESGHENPEERTDFARPDLRGYVTRERGRLLAAALTILRGFCSAGCPSQEPPAWGSYEGWSMIRDAVVWAGLPDPASNRKQVQAQSDTVKNSLALLLRAWAHAQSRLGDQRGDDEPDGLSAAHAIEVAGHDALLLEAIETFCPKPTPYSLGRRVPVRVSAPGHDAGTVMARWRLSGSRLVRRPSSRA